MEQHSLTLSAPQIAADQLGFFRWGKVAERVLVTNDAGDWAFLSQSEFDELLGGQIAETHPRFQEFQSKGFLRNGLDLDALIQRVTRRNRHVARGPHLHVATLTLRCAPSCPACETSGQKRVKTDVDMTPETAEKIIDLAFQSNSPSITFEFQGGEPLLNFEVLRHFVESARTRKDKAGKAVSFNLVSDFSHMTDETAEWLIAHDVFVCTTLDGPASVHDENRKWKGGSSHADVVRWIEHFNRRYAELGRDARIWRIEPLMTTTRRTIEAWKEVVDEYVTRGMPGIHLRPLTPAGFAREAWSTIGYTAQEYLDFYRHALDYILALNRKGVELVERTASIFLTKILTSDDPGLDIQSPSAAGTGQVAYSYDGRVFPCDEARMVDVMGDPMFELGQVGNLTLSDVLRHSTVRTIAAASLLDAQPMCADCWNKPFCGINPIFTYVTQSNLFGQRPRSFECKEHMYVSAKLFELLANETDSPTLEILKRWTLNEARPPGEGRALKEPPGHQAA